MEKMLIQAYKHDGSLHRIWEDNDLFYKDKDMFILENNKTKVIESDGRFWYTKEPAILLFYRNRFFDVSGIISNTGVAFYVNLASPALIDKEAIKYIDYDLDIKVFEDGTYKVLDLNEFENHANSLNYPEEIKKILKEELEGLIKKIENKESPFNKEYIMNLYNKYKNERNNNRR